MHQKNALWVAAALTAFVLVAIGAVTAGAVGLNRASAAAAAPVALVVDAPAAAPAEAVLDTFVPAPAAAPAYPVTTGQAAAIALNAAPGAQWISADLVNYQGTAAYEVNTDLGLIYVDAQTGQVLFNGAQTLAVNGGSLGGGEHEGGEHEGGEHGRGSGGSDH